MSYPPNTPGAPQGADPEEEEESGQLDLFSSSRSESPASREPAGGGAPNVAGGPRRE